MAGFTEQDILTRLYLALTTDGNGNPAFRTTLALGYGADSVKDTHIDWGTGANQVSAVDLPIADAGNYFATDNVEAALQALAAAAAASGAPSAATYLLQVPNGTLTNGQALSALATGILKSTTLTGVVSIAAQGVDYFAPSGTDVPVLDGGTGASDASGARSNLGLVIGTHVQAQSAALAAIAGLTPTDSNIIVGDGATWVAESGATARTSLGLGTIATQAANNVSITGGAISGITDLAVLDGGTGASDAATARTNLGLGPLVTSVGSPGEDTNIPSEKAVRTAITNATPGAATTSATGVGQLADLTAVNSGTTGRILTANLVKETSSGAAQGNIVALNADGVIDSSLLPTPVTNYGTGADGPVNITSGTTTFDCGNVSLVIKNYTTFNISAGATLNFTNVPAAGVLVIFLCTGNCTIAGTLDLSGKGSTGGLGVIASISSGGNNSVNGNPGTTPYNACGQTTRNGKAGSANSASLNSNASGGSGGANACSGASATSAANTAVAAAATSGLTTAMGIIVSFGLVVGPGAGGGSGGAGCRQTSGAGTSYSGNAGNGGGGLFIACGGTLTFTGTVNLSGTAASSGGDTTIDSNVGDAHGGSGGGAAGTGILCGKTLGITNGTITVSGGALSGGSINTSGTGTATKSDGTNGADGAFIIAQSY